MVAPYGGIGPTGGPAERADGSIPVYVTGGVAVVRNKVAAQSVTSSTVLVDDNDLVFAIEANATWVAQWILNATYNTSGQLQVAVTTPAGAAQLIIAEESPNGIVPAYGSTTASGTGINLVCTAATGGVVYVTATVVNGATPGNVTLRFAQQTSNAGPTTLSANSSLVAWKK